MALIKLENVNKTYVMGEHTVHALRSVFLSINEGEFVSILGASGSGKSTLLTIIGCMTSPSDGAIFFDNEEISNKNDEFYTKLRAEKIGFVFQSYHLLNEMSAMENTIMPLYYQPQYSGQQMKEMSKKALGSVGLEDRAHHRPSELSGGQQQRVSIARALIKDPKIIIADEPTGALDRSSTNQVLGIFQKLSQEKKTILIVTHDEEVAKHTNRIIRLKDGCVVSDEINQNPKIANTWNMQDEQKPDSAPLSLELKGVVNSLTLYTLEGLYDPNKNIIKQHYEKLKNNNEGLIEVLAVIEKQKLKNGESEEVIEECLAHSSWEIRAAACRLLGFLGFERQLKIVIEFLTHEKNSWVRYSAAKSLYILTQEELSSVFTLFRQDENEKIRSLSFSLAKVSLEKKQDTWNSKVYPFYFGAIMQSLQDSDGRVIANAIEFLGELLLVSESPEGIKLLMEYSVHENNRTAGNALLALWKIEHNLDHCLESIEKLTSSKNALNRLTSIYVLSEMIKNSQNEKKEVKEKLQELLFQLQYDEDQNVVDALIKAVRKDNIKHLNIIESDSDLKIA